MHRILKIKINFYSLKCIGSEEHRKFIIYIFHLPNKYLLYSKLPFNQSKNKLYIGQLKIIRYSSHFFEFLLYIKRVSTVCLKIWLIQYIYKSTKRVFGQPVLGADTRQTGYCTHSTVYGWLPYPHRSQQQQDESGYGGSPSPRYFYQQRAVGGRWNDETAGENNDRQRSPQQSTGSGEKPSTSKPNNRRSAKTQWSISDRFID